MNMKILSYYNKHADVSSYEKHASVITGITVELQWFETPLGP